MFDISVPPEFRKIVSLPLPASSLNESNSHNWDSGDVIENIKNNVDFIKKVVDGYESIAGKMLPPITITNYKSTSRRSFTFNFQFTPRSSAESEVINQIIEAFKIWSAPGSWREVGRVSPWCVQPYIYPKDSNLAKMLKLFPCVIKSVNVTYFDNGQVLIYKDGQPKSISLSVTLEELMIHNRTTLNATDTRTEDGVKDMAEASVTAAKNAKDVIVNSAKVAFTNADDIALGFANGVSNFLNSQNQEQNQPQQPQQPQQT